MNLQTTQRLFWLVLFFSAASFLALGEPRKLFLPETPVPAGHDYSLNLNELQQDAASERLADIDAFLLGGAKAPDFQGKSQTVAE